MSKVLFSSGHGEKIDLLESSPDGLSELQYLLREMNIGVIDILEGEIRQDFALDSVLVVLNPTIPFSDSQNMSIQKFVERGGGILLAAGGHSNKNIEMPINSLARSYGVFFNAGAVLSSPEEVWREIPRISVQGQGHAITKGVNEVVFSKGCTVQSDDASSVLISTDGKCIPPNSPIIVAKSYGLGRVVFSGSSQLFRNARKSGIVLNRLLVRNMFEWLSSKKQDAINILVSNNRIIVPSVETELKIKDKVGEELKEELRNFFDNRKYRIKQLILLAEKIEKLENKLKGKEIAKQRITPLPAGDILVQLSHIEEEILAESKIKDIEEEDYERMLLALIDELYSARS